MANTAGTSPEDNDEALEAEITGLEAKIAEMEGKAPDAGPLLRTMYGKLKFLRVENKNRRLANKTLAEENTTLKQEKKTREDAEKSALELAQARTKELEDQLAKTASDNEDLRTSAVFSADAVKAVHPPTLLLHWKALSPEERKATTPQAFAEKLKTEVPSLFKSDAGGAAGNAGAAGAAAGSGGAGAANNQPPAAGGGSTGGGPNPHQTGTPPAPAAGGGATTTTHPRTYDAALAVETAIRSRYN